MTEEIRQLAVALIPETCAKYWALMLFYRGYEIGLPNANAWVNTNNIVYQDHMAALDAYANTPCPASQLVEGRDRAELLANIKQMQRNYHDEKWLDENLYPYL